MNFLLSGRDKSFKPSIKISGTNTPLTQTTDTVSCSFRECNQFLTNTILLEHFAKIFLHLKKAVVRCAFLLNILFSNKHCITKLTIFYAKTPYTSEASKKLQWEKARISHLLQNMYNVYMYNVWNVRHIPCHHVYFYPTYNNSYKCWSFFNLLFVTFLLVFIKSFWKYLQTYPSL